MGYVGLAHNRSIKYTDVTTPHSTQGEYLLGEVYEIELDDHGQKSACEFIYLKSHGALTQYKPYAIGLGTTMGSEYTTNELFSESAASVQIAIPQIAVSSGYYFFGLIRGVGKGLVTSNTSTGNYVSGDSLSSALVNDGNMLFNTSVGRAIENLTLADESVPEAIKIIMHGRQVAVV